MTIAIPRLDRSAADLRAAAGRTPDAPVARPVHLHERSVDKLLRRLDFTRLQPRRYHPKQATAVQAAFKRAFARLAAAALPPAAAGKPLEIWFEDAARMGQQGSLTLGRWSTIRETMVQQDRQ